MRQNNVCSRDSFINSLKDNACKNGALQGAERQEKQGSLNLRNLHLYLEYKLQKKKPQAFAPISHAANHQSLLLLIHLAFAVAVANSAASLVASASECTVPACE